MCRVVLFLKMAISKQVKSLLCIVVVLFMALCCCYGDNSEPGYFAKQNSSDNMTICERRQSKTSHLSATKGYIGAFVAIIMFGSNFVPVKKIKTGDGVFFQWVVCLGIWFSGVFIHLYNGDDRQFFPLEMVGGAIWCVGNMCVVPIIKTIGLAMGLLIWGTINLLTGWATGRFGAFGLICKQPVKHSSLNYVGVILALISLGIFMFIKTEDSASSTNSHSDEMIQESGTTYDDQTVHLLKKMEQNNQDKSWIDRFSRNQKRLIGIFLSVVSGIFYGLCFIPVYIIQKNDGSATDDGIQYIFSQYCGSLFTSTVYFIVYCLYKRNKPNLYPQAAAPGFISGILWGIGQAGWFIANTYLSEAISFPIVTTGPGIIASIWGVFIFREFKGLKNFVLLGIAICFAVGGAVVTGFSK